jgi:hypothetical protein
MFLRWGVSGVEHSRFLAKVKTASKSGSTSLEEFRLQGRVLRRISRYPDLGGHDPGVPWGQRVMTSWSNVT